MAPQLEAVKPFTDLCANGSVETGAFLQAANGVVTLFDLVGSPILAVVKKHITGNIEKVRVRFNAAQDLSATLEQLVENEKSENEHPATQGLLWLLRGLSFVFKAVQNAQSNKSDELSVAFTQAYETNLKEFHNVVQRGIFSIGILSCPTRADFYTKLSTDVNGGPPLSSDAFSDKLDKYAADLETVVKHCDAFFKVGGHDAIFVPTAAPPVVAAPSTPLIAAPLIAASPVATPPIATPPIAAPSIATPSITTPSITTPPITTSPITSV